MTKARKDHSNEQTKRPVTKIREKTESLNKEDCRCKEVSSKSFTELLRLMLADLAFWKRTKKRN